MYNHYIPGSDGVYRRKSIEESLPAVTPSPVPMPSQSETKPCTEIPKDAVHRNTPDAGDLLLICIVLLLLLDCEGEDLLPVLVTAAALLFGL